MTPSYQKIETMLFICIEYNMYYIKCGDAFIGYELSILIHALTHTYNFRKCTFYHFSFKKNIDRIEMNAKILKKNTAKRQPTISK